jgi:hypothetical protein
MTSETMRVLRIVVALVAGIAIGASVNMGLVLLGSVLIPAPLGVDVNDPDSIAAGIDLFEPRHFLFPFIAHAGGTLVGALIAHTIAIEYRTLIAYVVGAASFAGGVAAAFMIPAPVWFVATDLVVAYFPMAYLATKIGMRLRPG